MARKRVREEGEKTCKGEREEVKRREETCTEGRAEVIWREEV